MNQDPKDREAKFTGYFSQDYKKARQQFQVSLRKRYRKQTILKNRNFPKSQKENTLIPSKPFQNKSTLLDQLKSLKTKLKNEKSTFSDFPTADVFLLLNESLSSSSSLTLINESLRILIDLSMLDQPSLNQELDKLISLIFHLLNSSSSIILENSVWLLANHSLSNFETRKIIANHENLPKILTFCENFTKTALGSASFRFISNLTRAKPQVTSSYFPSFLRIYLKFLPLLTNPETQEEVLWGIKSLKNIFSSFSENFDEFFLKSLLKYSKSFNASLQLPALKVVSNLLRQNLKIKEFKANDLLSILTFSLNSKSSRVLKTAAKAVFEALKGQIYSVRDLIIKGVTDKIFDSIPLSGLKVHLHFLSVLQVMVEDSDEVSFNHLLNDNLVQVLSFFLTSASDDVKITSLNTLSELLKKCETNTSLDEFFKLTEDFNKACGFEHLEALALHKMSVISKLASSVLESW